MLSPDLIQAVKAPFSILGESILLLSIVVLLAANAVDTPVARKVRRMAGLLAVFASCVTAMVIFQATKQIANDRAYRDIHATYSITVSIKGSLEETSVSEPVSFRVSSGQVNVGCNDRQTTNAVWPVPTAAKDVQASAAWENTDNARDLSQNVNFQPSAVTASGSIIGLDRNFFGNCTGGGHGELVLRGTYRVTRTELHGEQTLKTLSDKVNRLQPFIVEMPRQAGATPQSCEINIEEGVRKETVVVGIKVDENGKLSISAQKVVSTSGGSIPVSVLLDEQRLVVRVG